MRQMPRTVEEEELLDGMFKVRTCTCTYTYTFHADMSGELLYILESFPILSSDMIRCVELCGAVLSFTVLSYPVLSCHC